MLRTRAGSKSGTYSDLCIVAYRSPVQPVEASSQPPDRPATYHGESGARESMSVAIAGEERAARSSGGSGRCFRVDTGVAVIRVPGRVGNRRICFHRDTSPSVCYDAAASTLP